MPDTLEPLIDRPATLAPGPVVRRRRWPRLLALGVLILLVAAGILWWQNGGGQGAPSAAIATAPVTRGDLDVTVSALGSLEPLQYVDVGAQVSGQVQRILVDIGDTVQEGDLLAEIDPRVYQARVDSDNADLMRLQAQLDQQEAQLTLAQQQLDRQTQMLRANATSQDAYQSAAAAVDVARAAIAITQAQNAQAMSTLDADQANLEYTKIRAPMAGTVMSLTARQGQTINANQSAPIILQIANLDVMTVTTEVSEADIGKLAIGMKAYFTTLGNPDRRWQGTLRQILPTPTVENNVVLYDALFDVDNQDHQLLPQMTAQVFFQVQHAEDALLIPVVALGPPVGDPAENKREVRVLTPRGIEPRTVTVGVQSRVTAEVVDGLQEGDRVVTGQAQAGESGRRRRMFPFP